ncbi:MAG: alpha/beta hydrolase [Alphaproteobacteria bacterium]|nr:MAG: alpha/beta hydrolase [Alphaproteobacteria bacterium]
MENPPNHRRARPQGARFGTWTAPDGWAIRKMDWPQPGRRKARGSLIFAGGRGDFIEKYLEAFAHWHDRGWNVTAFDWRGQGGSQGDGYRFDSFDALIDDCAALIADWRGGTAGPHVAIGHSMGGHLLLRTLVEAQPALDAAVLVAPMIGVNSAPLPGWLAPDVAETMALCGFRNIPMWKAPPALQVPGGQRQRILTGSRERYEDELWWWRQEPEWELGAPTWGWMRAAFRSAASAFTAERLAAVRLPILILAAGKDRLVSNGEISRAAALLPDARLEEFPKAAHEILREADAVRNDALARIDAFLDERAA